MKTDNKSLDNILADILCSKDKINGLSKQEYREYIKKLALEYEYVYDVFESLEKDLAEVSFSPLLAAGLIILGSSIAYIGDCLHFEDVKSDEELIRVFSNQIELINGYKSFKEGAEEIDE